MQKSIFFRRVLALLLLALLLWTFLTAVLYGIISRPIFTQIKVNELQPRAVTIANMAAKSFLEYDPYLDSLLSSAYEFFDAWIFVVDGLSGEIRNTTLPAGDAAVEPQIRDLISRNLDSLTTGQYSSVWFTSRLHNGSGSTEMLFIGVPVTILFNRQSKVVGAVFFVRPQDELNAGLSSMNIALLVSALLVLALMIIPTYLATARLIMPLRQTRNVALAMANGDFSVRADARQRGEIGELAATMNNLAHALAANLSALTLERNRLQQVLAGMSDGLIAVDPDLQVTLTNPAVICLLDQPDRTDTPQALADFPDGAALHQAFQESVVENRDVEIVLRHNGLIIRGQIAPLTEETGHVAGAVGLFHDITESERLEQTRRDYVANVSHELRTPLTAMRALLEPLKDGMVAGEADRQRYYGIMLREVVRLARLINDMLELSRLQAGTVPMAQSAFDLRDILSDLAERFSVQAEESGLQIVLPENLQSCPPVYGNPDRVEQVLIILIDNAIKFTPENGTIHLLLDWDNRKIQISVQDSGIGIAPEDAAKVFDRFYKADKAHQQPGTGLGLAIAREILLRMGQTIRVRSELGQGSVFTFTLDLAA